jgi:hypothetical protein
LFSRLIWPAGRCRLEPDLRGFLELYQRGPSSLPRR